MIQLLIFIIGLLLFLYGIHLMSTSLEQLALKRMRKIIEVMTNTRMKAIIVGVVMSALLHSSSTLTILIIALTSSGHMKLKQAMWIVMGANVGTTLSSGLFFINLDLYVYLLMILGCVLYIKYKYAGKAMIGLSLLLFGLQIMSSSLLSLQNKELFTSILNYVDQPLILVGLGIVICGTLQSSSACMAILLSFSKSGLITFFQGAYLLYGFDIGTCLDTSLASITSNKEGRKVAIFHLLFNITGTMLFTLISLFTPFLSLFEMMNVNLAVLFTLLHSVMNIMTLVLFGCINDYIIKLLNKYIC